MIPKSPALTTRSYLRYRSYLNRSYLRQKVACVTNLSRPRSGERSYLRYANILFFFALLTFTPHLAPSCLAQATITIDFVDEKTGEPIPCRVELRDAKGKPQKGRGALQHAPWTIVDSQLIFRGRVGDYTFDVHHGPEYAGGGGGFTLDKDGEGSDVVRLPRHANMANENYFAADRLTFITPAAIAKWLPAEGLQSAAVCTTTVANDPAKAAAKEGSKEGAKDVPPQDRTNEARHADGRWSSSDSYFDDRPGSGLVFHHWLPPAAVPEALPTTKLLVLAKQKAETRAEIVRLWARDTPQWLASGRIDAIQVLSEHVTRDGKSAFKVSDMYHPEPAQFRGARGSGRLVENLYWQVLEAGLHIPPSAGSAVGRSSSPLGYNRVYVNLPGSSRTPEHFEEALYAGRSFVTNGPLLRAKVNDELPGATLKAAGGNKLGLNVSLELTVADPVEYVDVVFNGDALYHAPLDEYAKQGGKIPRLEVDRSGWLVVRVVTSREETYRLATTAPFYVQFDGQNRISKAACQMFLDWLESSYAEQKKSDASGATAVEPFYSAAKKFWQARIENSNAP